MRKKIIAAVAAIALSATVLSGCVFGRTGIISIEKSRSEGLVDYYTITYTDGTTDEFTVTNGRDGQKGETGSGVTA